MSSTPLDYTIAVVARTFDLLEALADAGTPIGATELACRTGTTKSAAYRILTTLEGRGYVTKDVTTTLYQLGPRFAHLARRATNPHDVRTVARPLLEELHRRFRETVNLGVCDDGLVVYIDMIESDLGLRMAAHLGARDYLHSTALGKAILASLPEEVRERFLLAPLPARTARTITDRGVLRAELERIRHEGVAEDRGENEDGSRCYGAPILDDTGVVIAALSVSAPESRVDDERAATIARAVREVAQQVTLRLGGKTLAPHADR